MTINKEKQVFTIPTFDAAFKWILDLDSIRPSFFHAFMPDLVVESSTRIDDSMNLIKALQILRTFVHDAETQEIVDYLAESKSMEVHAENQKQELKHNKAATKFLNKIISRFEDIKTAFPKPEFDGTMDFVCRLGTGESVLIEMQVAPQDYWDRRALAYASALYGNQMKEKMKWGEIQRVIAINILGGGNETRSHWKDTPDQFVRHYRMQEQIHKDSRFLDGIEIIQYSLENTAKEPQTQEQKDWVTFFRSAHRMTEEEVAKQIKTPAVLLAFKRAKIADLPGKVRKKYEEEDEEYNRFSIHNAETFAEGEAIGEARGEARGEVRGEARAKIEIAKELLRQEMSIETICKITKLSKEDLLREGLFFN